MLAVAAFSATQPRQSYCIAVQPTVLLIIDVTTEYDDRDRDLLMEAVRQITAALQGGERLIIRTITDTYTTSDRLFDQCAPVCIPQRRAIFGGGCSRGTIEMDKRRTFGAVTTALRDRLRRFESRDHSDIIRTLSEIGRDLTLGGRPNRVYVFSDMIEHSQILRGADFFTVHNSRLIERVRARHLVPSLDQVRVQVFGVGRSGLPGRPPLSVDRLDKLRDFWTRYFAAAGAASTTITAGLPN